MVFLTIPLLRQVPKGAAYGLYAGKEIMHGFKVTRSQKKTKRRWFPNVQRKTYYSQILGVHLQLRVTTKAMRCIDKAGGFDSYLYHTPPDKLQSKLGEYLKGELSKTITEQGLTPPPLIKRYPQQPKSLRDSYDSKHN